MSLQDLSTSVLTGDDFEYSHVVDTILHGNNNEIVHEFMKIQCLAQGVQDYVFELLKSEVKTLCLKSTNSLLRQCEKGDLLTLSFKNIAQEWTEKAPLFYKFLDCVSVNPSAEARNVLKKGNSILQAQVAAGCKLLNVFNREMKSLQLINDIVLLKGGMKKSGFTRLQSTNDCQSYMSAITLADKIASDWDRELLKWKQELELEIEQENRLLHQIVYALDTLDLCNDSENVETINELTLEKSNLEARLRDYRSDMHPGYYFVGDNVDMVTKVRQMTSSNQNKDQHMYQMCAYQNRVSGNNLDNEKQLQDPAKAPFGKLIPGETEKKKLSENFAYLVAKRWCQYLTYFGPFEGVLQEYIEHPYMRETKKCTKRVRKI